MRQPLDFRLEASFLEKSSNLQGAAAEPGLAPGAEPHFLCWLCCERGHTGTQTDTGTDTQRHGDGHTATHSLLAEPAAAPRCPARLPAALHPPPGGGSAPQHPAGRYNPALNFMGTAVGDPCCRPTPATRSRSPPGGHEHGSPRGSRTPSPRKFPGEPLTAVEPEEEAM